MSVTVRDILNMAELKGANVLAGASGLDRPVSNVNVMEAPDIVRWLHGGEFILTAAYAFRSDPESLMALLEQMRDSGVSALGIKLKRFIDELPSSCIAEADRLCLPVVELPSHLAFGDIIFPILSKIVDESVGDVRFSEAILRSFYSLMASGGTIQQILYTIRSFLREDVGYIDVIGRERYVCGASRDFDETVHCDTVQSLIHSYISEPVALAGKIYGYIVINVLISDDVDRQWSLVLEHAKSAVLVCAQRDMVARETERRYRDEFVQDLLFKNIRFERELWARAERFDWDFRGRFQVIVADIDGYKSCIGDSDGNPKCIGLEEKREKIIGICVDAMRASYPKIPYTTMTDMVVFLLPLKEGSPMPPLKDILPRIRAMVKERTGFSVTIGVGEPKESCFLCHESYDEAREAINTIRPIMGGDREVYWGRMGMYSVLASISRSTESERFYMSQLGPLITMKDEGRSELLDTLEALVHCNWSLKNTASHLCVHYNTLRYRMEKVHQLLGSDLESSDDRLSVAMALKLYVLSRDRTFR